MFYKENVLNTLINFRKKKKKNKSKNNNEKTNVEESQDKINHGTFIYCFYL